MEISLYFQYYCLVGILCIINTITSEEYINEETLREYAAQYPQPQNEAMYEKLMYEGQQRQNWAQPPVESQVVDVQSELLKLNESHKWQPSWPTQSQPLGVVTAVSFDTAGNLVVFHRADHVWDQATFDNYNRYAQSQNSPIHDNTIIAFDRKSGNVVYEWGKDMFFMPHGLHIDQEGNTWVTDVALHQVMKFGPNNRTHPELVLGNRFQPGTSNKFCKPTGVAVLPDGDFFIADGYCNARILKFSKTGEMILAWGKSSFGGIAMDVAPENYFAVPHALTLAADQDLLCVADRENGRVQCFRTKDGLFHSQYHSPLVGDRLFSVAYAPVNGGQLYVVNGPQSSPHEVGGFVLNMKSKRVVSRFGKMENPHDIIVTPDGQEVYVAQLYPNRVFKFVSPNLINAPANPVKNSTTLNLAPVIVNKPTVTLDNQTSSFPTGFTNGIIRPNKTQALIIAALFTSFMIGTLVIILLISRRRKLGCYAHDSRNRRHAWDFPAVKKDGFKLGNLLERKRGFQQLGQEASDEENQENANAHMLPAADASLA